MESNGGTAKPKRTAAIYQSRGGNPEDGSKNSSRKPILFNNVSFISQITTKAAIKFRVS